MNCTFKILILFLMKSSNDINFSKFKRKNSVYVTPRMTKSYVHTPLSIENLKSEITKFDKEIESLSTKNASSRGKCSKYIKNIEAITKGLDKNIDMLTETNDNLEITNCDLRDLINRQNALMIQLSLLYRELESSGVDLKKFENVDYNFLVRINGEEIPVKDHSINDEIRDIINRYEYFSGCRSYDEFLKRCQMLVEETSTNHHHAIPKFKCKNYQEKIDKLNEYNEKMHAKLAEEMNQLVLEKDNIQRNFNYSKYGDKYKIENYITAKEIDDDIFSF